MIVEFSSLFADNKNLFWKLLQKVMQYVLHYFSIL